MEKEPRHKAAILEKIANVQPYLSAYCEATKMVIKESRNVIDYTPDSNKEELGMVDEFNEEAIDSNSSSRQWYSSTNV
jgi:hypothetical protein